MKIQLYWADFYKQMKAMNMEDDEEGFEKILISMFKKQFNVKRLVIDWMD